MCPLSHRSFKRYCLLSLHDDDHPFKILFLNFRLVDSLHIKQDVDVVVIVLQDTISILSLL